ncbi:hypothetical protein K469DRAFT_748811 [Zopfia rhizophila CBS 207.26]|uniref:RING-type domain-containing protein n=1 Tax=Zopfia rhizophila CBS 207.26 TaxID=1314779 RepID=A0A6A6E7V5_9PEZI|nr:hypothetical protein K469DRAFT_748811 [Zopfia rhizophila CBS 207.26]
MATSTADSSSNPETLWDISSVIPKPVGYTCIGHARSKGRRCLNKISHVQWNQSESSLKELETETQSHNLEGRLSAAVPRFVCHVHQNQVPEIVARWKEKIESLQQQAQGNNDGGDHTSASTYGVANTPAAVPRSESAQTAPDGDITALADALRWIAAEFRRIRETQGHAPETRSEGSAGTPLPSAASSETQQPPTSGLSAATSSSTGCTNTHVNRRPVDSDCLICSESIADTPLAELIWCKSQCGQNLHRMCLAHWQISSAQLAIEEGSLNENDEIPLRCPSCRTEWALPCEHDDEPYSVADHS